MSPRNPDKNKEVLKELEKTISPVLVVNNSTLKPYVELFDYAPENIYQQPLGSLVGFFEIKEYSKDSAYVVNFLTSVLKKEYYINPKRPVTESLDSALHKVNIALSELAKQGNIEWLGKIHAAICVLEKNNAHFSVSGNAKIFLYRNTVLSEISEDLASDSLDPHPLKTFINVSSGRLEKNDRLLITSGDIFHILPITEIKKSFQRLEGDKFVQFLKTALSNQMEMIASIAIEMTEPAPEETKASARKKVSRTTNVFSEATFANSKSKDALSQQEQDNFNALEENSDDDSETIEKKLGNNYGEHIYIQGEAADNETGTNPQIHLYQDLIKEKITQSIYVTKNEVRKRFSLFKKQMAKRKAIRLEEKERQRVLAEEQAKHAAEQRVLDEIENEQRLAKQRELDLIRMEEERIAQQEFEKQQLIQEKLEAKALAKKQKELENASPEEIKEIQISNFELSFKEKLQRAKMEQQKNAIIDLRKKNETTNVLEEIRNDFEEEQEIFEEYEEVPELEEKSSKLQDLKSFAIKASEKILPMLSELKTTTVAHTKKLSERFSKQKTESRQVEFDDDYNESKLSLVPHFSKIKALFSRFSKKQKLYTLGAFALIFIVPLFIVQFLNRPKPVVVAELPVIAPTQAQLLANEKNINTNIAVQNILTNPNIVASLIANDNPTLITKTSIIILQNGQPKEFPLPANSGTPIKSAFMKDLSLVLVISDNGKIISFSPVSEKFTENNITLTDFSSMNFVGTYLTYLYVLDQKANQIYRYPRAEGGFGEKTNWLKDATALSGVSDMTIDDNIYAIQNNQVLKFFKGKKVDFSLEKSTTPVEFGKLYTTPDLTSLYALDTQNSRLVQYSKDGNIVTQYFNEALKNGTSLAVDEKNKAAYIATSSGLISLSIQ